MASAHAARYFTAAAELANAVDGDAVDLMAEGLAAVRENSGRLFAIGVGGGAGHASHAVNDFRKLCGIEMLCPERQRLRAHCTRQRRRVGHELREWLKISRVRSGDALIVFSVGGGSREHNVSVNLVNAMELAREAGASIFGIVGAPGGTLAELADVAVIVEPASRPQDAARRIVPGSRLACTGVASCARDQAGPLGVDQREVTDSGLLRPRRHRQRARARP